MGLLLHILDVGGSLMARKWYQNVDGVKDAVFKDPGRKESKFWGEGKWNNFIKPLLPQRRRTFIEIGCNAGLFLKMATDAGFRDVIGIEPSKSAMGQAKDFRDANKGTYKLIQQKVGVNFALDELPLADVVLLANVHYYIPLSDFMYLVDRLKSRTVYCIIVSAKAGRRSGAALHYLEAVRKYFWGWEEIMAIGDWQGTGAEKGDPAPRKQMYGVLFKGNLDVMDVTRFYDDARKKATKSSLYSRNAVFPAAEEFFGKVLAREVFDFETTLLYQYYRKRHPSSSPEAITRKLVQKKALAEDIQKNGMKEPIYVDGNNKLLDGFHRLILARKLGYENVIIRRL